MAKKVALYKLPKNLEVAKILDDSILGAYKDSIQPFNEIARQTLGKFDKRNGDLTGSNPFMLIHLANLGLLSSGARLTARRELEVAVSYDNSFLRENYTDFGLALRNAGDSYTSNDLLAKKLAEQLKQRGISFEEGKLIPLTALKLVQDSNSKYGLVFELSEQAEKGNIQNLNDFKWNYTRDNGLARAYFDRGGDWLSYDGCRLEVSDDDGRVVLVSAEGTSQNFLEEQFSKLQKRRNEEIAQIQRRYSQAEANNFK